MTTIIHSMDIVVAFNMPLSTAGSPTVVTGVAGEVPNSTAGSLTVVTGRTSKVSTCQLFMLRSDIISITDIVISAVSLTMCSFVSDGLAAVTAKFGFYGWSRCRIFGGGF